MTNICVPGAQAILQHKLRTTELPLSLRSYAERQQPSLWTVLHHAAASRSADRQVLQRIVQQGAFLSLKTWYGETAYDIAIARGRGEDITNILRLPDAVTDNRESIARMEAALHGIIHQRCQSLLTQQGIQLPQISLMWERRSTGEGSMTGEGWRFRPLIVQYV